VKNILILALALSLGLAACGKKGALQPPGTPPESERPTRTLF
jgi:predicted small lipoprotein YifL